MVFLHQGGGHILALQRIDPAHGLVVEHCFQMRRKKTHRPDHQMSQKSPDEFPGGLLQQTVQHDH